jgi:SAM-dependent methyltransferase
LQKPNELTLLARFRFVPSPNQFPATNREKIRESSRVHLATCAVVGPAFHLVPLKSAAKRLSFRLNSSVDIISYVNLRTAYDAWHQRNYDLGPDHEDASSPWYKLVREYLTDVAGLRVLEVACGRGGFTLQLARAGGIVTGCDFSLAALRITQEKLRLADIPTLATLVQGDAQTLPFANDSFDILVSCETIEHVPDVQGALCEFFRVTRPGGRLFLTTPNYFNFMGLYEIYARFRHPSRNDDQPFDRRQWFPQVHNWLRHAGWSILCADGTVHQFPFFPGRNPVRWQALEASRMLRRLLSPFAFTYFVCAAKPVGPLSDAQTIEPAKRP